MIDQIGGWATAGGGQAYGERHNFRNINKFMEDGILFLAPTEYANNFS